MRLLLVMIFGVLGVLSRYFGGLLVSRWLPPPFPYGTFLINLTGAFLIGVIQVLGVERADLSPDLRVGIMVGFLGGYTTFSSYCLESIRLIEEGQLARAAVYFVASPALGLLAVTGGIFLTRALLGAP